MKLSLRFVTVALLLGACAPAAPPTAVPAPAPARPPAATPAPAPAAPIARTFTEVPARWWLLDVEKDGVYGAGVDRAYAEVLNTKQPQRSVVVAIIDSGVEITHEDLDGVLWTNTEETRNGRDDDGNGYIDDIHGWNFIGGADGDHVDVDTYEVTRLHAACIALHGGGTPARQPAEQPAREDCPAIARDFQAKRQENEQLLMQIQQIEGLVANAVRLLQQQVGSDSLTLERVRALTPTRPDVAQAQQIYMQMAQQGITAEVIASEKETVQNLLQYSLNPEFDPRHIVGDNYADETQRVYGNPDVTGPDAAHGTGVAGIVGAERNNTLGVDGIAPRVQIMAIRTVPNGDERDKDVANAIRYAVDNGAHIINMSFGKAWSPEKDVVDAAVRYADEKGVLMIHAAGNDAKNLATAKNFPTPVYADGGRARNWIEVGASNWPAQNRLASEFSNYGREQVDVFAPGSTIESTTTGNDYSTASGTSFAAPVVTGIAAMLMAYYPDLSATDVRRIILESAIPLRDQMVIRPGEESAQVRFGELSVTGGIVNAYRAAVMAERK